MSSVIIPASTMKNISSATREKYLLKINGYRRKAIEDYFNRIIGKAAWLTLLEEGGYPSEKIQEEYLFENFPRNGFEYNKEELEANDSYMVFIPESVDGSPITLKFFEDMGFQFSFNDHVYGYQEVGEQFSSLRAPKGIFIVRANIVPDSTHLCLSAQKKKIPQGYSFSHPLVEITKNALLSSLGEEVNKNYLARCVCWDSNTISIVGGVQNKKMHFYKDDNSLSGKYIGASAIRSIIA